MTKKGAETFRRNYARGKPWEYRVTSYRFPEDKERFNYELANYAVFGLSVEEIGLMLLRQNYACGVCGNKLSDKNGRHLCVDHDHSTKIVRGLTHNYCNGHFLPVIEKYGDRAMMFAAVTPVDVFLET